jgi:Asparagine synthase (glutamine-hydrolyzing)
MISEKDMVDQLSKLIRFRDAPVSGPSDIPIYLLSVETRRSVKMVLTGEGGDEILAGYPKHVIEPYVGAYQKIIPATVHNRLIEPLMNALPYRFNRAKTAIRNLGLRNAEERLPSWFGALSPNERDKLTTLRPAHLPTAQSGMQFDTVPANSALRRVLCFDQTSWLPDNLLERGDRMTMAASLEARMLFLDHQLCAFVSALPDHYRLRGRQTKRLLREAMAKLLPRRILERSKVGFKVPVNEWFRGTMRDYVREHLLSTESRTRDYYRHDRLGKLWDEHIRGRHNHEKLLWSLLNLEVWL